MRTIRNNNRVNNNVTNTTAQSSTSTAATAQQTTAQPTAPSTRTAQQKPTTSRRTVAPAPVEAPKPKFADLTEEQQQKGLALMYIMERVTNREGVKWLELDKKSDKDNVIIRPVASLDEKVRRQATWAISTSARQLGGKYDKTSFCFLFPRDEFKASIGYYNLAKADGKTTVEAAKPTEQKPAAPSQKPADKPRTQQAKPADKQKDKNLITKADALARCRKALAMALTQEVIECIDDELQKLFA